MITDFTPAFQIGQTLYIENLGSIPKVLDAMSTLVDPDTISKVSELLQATFTRISQSMVTNQMSHGID